MHLYIVHGYAASPNDHWFPWLKNEIEKRGTTVSIINLPAPDAPQPEAWQRTLEREITELNEDTYFVAHSLGCLALLRFLESRSADTKVGGYVLVSGFNAPLSILPQLDGFHKPDLDYDKLMQMTSERTVIAARDDTIVPFMLSQELAHFLDARFIAVERGNHFMESDGFTEFPLVLDALGQGN